jgi:penicillin-binding protein-related factor A (putative recombinase)
MYSLYYPEKYAGTADCVGVYEGQSCIIDFKQSQISQKKLSGLKITICNAQHML